MAASLGLGHETYSSPLYNFPPLVADNFPSAAVMDGFPERDVVSAFDNSPPPVFAGGAGENEMMNMYGSTIPALYRSTGGDAAAGRIGFRTRSEVEVMDDGFKWRKYGKKAVKSSPNPRNYYRCSAEGCGVKKRVERDSGDPRYVLTTYDGVHNHATPGTGHGHGASLAAAAYSAPSSSLGGAPWSGLQGLVGLPAPTDAWGAVQLYAHAAAHSTESSY